MKIITRRIFLCAFVLMLASASSSFACNLSDITMCGINTVPLIDPNFPNDSMICLTVCNGYGRTGISKGADNDTRSIGFGWYDSNAGFLIRDYNPYDITSARGFDDCTMPSINIGPQGAPYNSQGTVVYIDPGYYGSEPCLSQPFGCVQSTADCGNAAQQCVTYYFQVNQIPDSVRVFGVEGGGNPLSGCYPDADMMHWFGNLAVEWGGLEGIARENSVLVKWSTLSEVNADFFVLERAVGTGAFEEIGTLAASGNSSVLKRYEMVDLAPMPGMNRYRVVEVDKEGKSGISPAVEILFDGPEGLVWGAVGPNPATDHVNVTFYDDHSESLLLTISSMDGKVIHRQDVAAISGANAMQLALDKVNAGTYFIHLQGKESKLTRKLVKL